jgi:NTE family protein
MDGEAGLAGYKAQRAMRGDSVFLELGDALRSRTFMGSPWARLALTATPAHVSAGDWLFREGEDGDSIYVILSGRLEVVAETPEPTVLWRLGRGEAVGELAVLTGEPRPASVVAIRDADLLRVSREDFLALLREEPDFAAELLRILGLQLQGVRKTSFLPDPLPSTVALLPLDPGLDPNPFAERLAAAFPRSSPAILRRPDSGDEGSRHSFGRLVDRCERSHEHVLLVASDEGLGDAWSRFCVRAGDRLLGLTRIPGPPPDPLREPALRGLDLVVLGRPEPQPLSAWVDLLEARATHLIDAPGFDATAALARGLSGASVGLVLSGGGARGFAHIGVLDELLSAGVSIDRVAGTSMGAYIAGLFALGLSPDEIAARCHEEFVVRNPMNDYTIPLVALTRGQKGLGMLTRSFGTARIEALARHFFCLSTDLVHSRLVVHRRGSMVWTVGASTCLPTIFPPAPTPDGLLVDGGVLNNLPAEQMAASGEGPVIACDVSTHLPPPQLESAPFSGSRQARMRRQLRALVVGMDSPLPNIREILLRAITVGSIDSDAAAREYADIVITPQLDEFGLFSWKALERLREQGRRAARAALAEAPSTLLSSDGWGGLKR